MAWVAAVPRRRQRAATAGSLTRTTDALAFAWQGQLATRPQVGGGTRGKQRERIGYIDGKVRVFVREGGALGSWRDARTGPSQEPPASKGTGDSRRAPAQIKARSTMLIAHERADRLGGGVPVMNEASGGGHGAAKCARWGQ
eukprot:scaffold258424_cov37-Tisochrysis_lutea.AAC.6